MHSTSSRNSCSRICTGELEHTVNRSITYKGTVYIRIRKVGARAPFVPGSYIHGLPSMGAAMFCFGFIAIVNHSCKKSKTVCVLIQRVQPCCQNLMNHGLHLARGL